ncbi:MAG: dTMP kinase, partial [Bdellovibrionota bacterium]
ALASARFGFQKVVLTREPGGSPVAEKIRSILLGHPMDRWTELFLYEASRAEHLAKTILPALNAGNIVLCDRFTDSSLAYQSFARGLSWKDVKALNHYATQGIKPQLSFLIDIDPELGLSRAQEHNRFEAEGLEFQKKVRQGFLKSVREDRKRWTVVRPGTRTSDEIAAEVLLHIVKRFKKRFKGVA